MANLKSKTVLVYDYGQFVELAVTLSKSFGRTLYFAPWVMGGAPTSKILRIGEGIAGIERVDEIWPHLDDIDLVVFPDAYEPGLQEYLQGRGKRVWGARSGSELELDRVKSKQLSKTLRIDIAPYKVVTGIEALRSHLKANDDQWVKISNTRGDMETFHAKSYAASEQRLDELEHNLGAEKSVMEFVVEAGIDPAVEVGYDGYTVDGGFPDNSLVGVETKGKAYFGRTMAYRSLPKQVRSVNEKLAPALEAYGYRGFISTEIRCKGDKAYLIDPCCRCGTPPSELYQVMIENLGDVLYDGAGGDLVEPDYREQYGAMVMLSSEWAMTNWQHVRFPDNVRENVKLHNMRMIDGQYYVIPHIDGRSQIGAVVATGNTADAAIAECKRIADLVEGEGIEKQTDALDQAREQLDKIVEDAEPSRPSRRARTKADVMLKRGDISEKQYQRMIAEV